MTAFNEVYSMVCNTNVSTPRFTVLSCNTNVSTKDSHKLLVVTRMFQRELFFFSCVYNET